MHDTMLLTAALSMVDQPVAVSRKERIAFMNTAAITLAGRNLTGKPTALLIPSHIIPRRRNSPQLRLSVRKTAPSR